MYKITANSCIIFVPYKCNRIIVVSLFTCTNRCIEIHIPTFISSTSGDTFYSPGYCPPASNIKANNKLRLLSFLPLRRHFRLTLRVSPRRWWRNSRRPVWATHTPTWVYYVNTRKHHSRIRARCWFSYTRGKTTDARGDSGQYLISGFLWAPPASLQTRAVLAHEWGDFYDRWLFAPVR